MSICTDLLGALRDVSDPGGRLLVVHSSLAHLKPPSNLPKWEVVRAIQTLANEGLTLALPAFTFSFCAGKPFDPVHSPSETGQLADWVAELGGALRTRHPIYSFVVIGPLAGEIAACRNSTTFGDDSSFAYFERVAARVAMLGCGWTYCTQFHRYEEEASVPYRCFKVFKGQLVLPGGPAPVEAKMYVRDLELDPVNDFSEAVRKLRQEGKIAARDLWGGRVEAAAVPELADACRALLREDAWVFVRDPGVTAYRLRQLRVRPDMPPVRVALLGDANLERLKVHLHAALQSAMGDLNIVVHTVPFGQFLPEALNPASDLGRETFDFVFVIERPEDLMGTPYLDLVSSRLLLEKGGLFVKAVGQLRSTHQARFFVTRFSCLTRSVLGHASPAVEGGVARVLDQLNLDLEAQLHGAKDTYLVDLERWAVEHTGGPAVDHRLWFLGRFPFGEGFTEAVAKRLTALMLASLGRSSRLAVLDLDNTLWGGVLGEDGIKGLKLGGDFPGNAFLAFQQLVGKLADRGIALALVSKNDEAHALRALETLPLMALKRDSFVACRINWRPKWENVRDICRELSLGTESVLFIDDNPVERAEMQRHLPGVKVLELPADPALYGASLLECPWIESLALTKEDLARAASYEARRDLEATREHFHDAEAFYASLQPRLSVQPLDNSNLVRLAQLVNKTNQFNVTTRRYSEAQLEAFQAAGHDVVAIGLEDKFSPGEIIGALIAKYDEPEPGWVYVDTYLLSCRVLGRGIETGSLHWLLLRAAKRGYRGVVGEIIATERNTPARGIYEAAGFSQDVKPGRWRRSVADPPPGLPDWITLVDQFENSRP